MSETQGTIGRSGSHVSLELLGQSVGSTAARWYARVRAQCNPVEVEVSLTTDPPPAGWEAQAYAAACYALAGKMDRAAARIDALQEAQRWRAAGIVFEAGHPVADAGDDEAAGPIMELVVQYWPNHYMALYHAGMAEYRLGELRQARQNLEMFLREYKNEDGWRSSAVHTLAELAQRGQP
jgi:tetratricopeptide (TPR) repeat protein